MPFNGTGTFVRAHDWTDDADNDINIDATRMDEEDDGFATGLSNCLTKDGQTTATANQPMGGYKHTGVGNAAARDQYVAAGQIQDNSLKYATVGGTADAITLTITPAIASYTAGQEFLFKATGTNTGATTINVSSLGAKNATKDGSTALAAGDITTGQLYKAIYDGTAFQIFGVDTDTVKSNETKNLTAGYTATSYDAGTKSSGTFTPDMTVRNVQHYTNGGAHTLAPPSSVGTLLIEIVNDGSAGAITTSGFTKVEGTFTTTNGHKFHCFISKGNSYSFLNIQALQ